MNKLSAITLSIALAFASTAYAGGFVFTPSGSFFVLTNGSINDGWNYTRHWSRGCWHYTRHSAIVVQAAPVAVAPPAYSANWKAEVLTYAREKQDLATYSQTLRELGITSPYGASGYVSQFTATTQYGAPGAYYGLAAFAPGIGQFDNSAARADLNRTANNLVGAVSRISAHEADLANTDAATAKMVVAGQIAIAAIQATQQPSTTTFTAQVENRAQAATDPTGTNIPARPFGSLNATIQDALLAQHCAKCHSGATHKGFDVTALTPAMREAGLRRVLSQDPAKVMPPPSEGRLSFEDVTKLIRGVP